MKRIYKIAVLALTILLFGASRNTASAQVSVGISYQTFYDDLSPYGDWIDYPEYGYVWCPDQGPDFRPYSTGGHWEWSDEYEWTWVSDYDWGWAPFHYGRWLYDPYYGWLWVPGYEWAPAWVIWRSGGDYCGWAPLRPGVNIGLDFSIGLYNPPIDYWCFAPRAYITSPRIYDYCVSPRQNVTIINNTTIINNYNYSGRGGRNVFVTGPRRNDVEGWTHQRLRSVDFRDSYQPGRAQVRNNEISIYRPNVQRDNSRQYSPRSFDRYGDRGNNNAYRNRGNDNVNRGNNLPRENGNVFDRRNNDQQRNEQGRGNPFERRENTSPYQNRGQERSQQIPQPNNDQNRGWQRRNQDNSQPNNDQRRMNPVERNNESSPYQNRGWERRDNGNQNPRQMERRQWQQPQVQPQQQQEPQRSPRQENRQWPQPQQQQPRQFERQQSQPQPQQQQPRQFERQQSQPQPQQQQQQQSRPWESRGNGNGNSDNRGQGNNGNGRGHGRHE